MDLDGILEFLSSKMSKCFNFSLRPKREVTIDMLPDEILLHIFQFLPVTEVLLLAGVCRRWRKLATDSGLWRNTKVVCSSQLGRVCPKTVGIIKSHGTIVNHLRMQYILKYPFLSSLIGLCKNLVTLEMIMCRIQVEFVEDLKTWPNLKKLNLKNSLLAGGPLLLPLSHFKHLTFLCLSDFGLTTENCESLLQCHDLNHILIEKIIGLRLEYIKELIKTKQNTLITFHIYGGESVDDECLMMLGKCPRLKDLSINRCENLTNRALDGAAIIPKITHLKLWNSNVFSERKLKETFTNANLWKLQRLNFSKIDNLTASVIDVIAEHCKDLKFFSVYRCRQITNTDYEKQLKLKFRNVEVLLY